MLNRIDRIQLAVPEPAEVAERWIALLGAEPAGHDLVRSLRAARTSLRLGQSWVELLSPDGAGALDDALTARSGPHLFAAGVSTARMTEVVARLESQGRAPVMDGGQAFLAPTHTDNAGLRVVISEHEELAPVGDVDFLYEVTLLAGNEPAATVHIADLFDLDTDNFVPITSAPFSYEGILTRFDPARLDRFEVIVPTDAQKTMGRFHARVGDCYYMAFAESDALPLIEQRALARGDGHTLNPADAAGGAGTINSMFLHPPALGGMMLGISRRTQAWNWSGRPDLVEAAK